MMSKETAQRTAALGRIFGTDAPQVRNRVSRAARTITRKDCWGLYCLPAKLQRSESSNRRKRTQYDA